jgi:hypothetical protein
MFLIYRKDRSRTAADRYFFAAFCEHAGHGPGVSPLAAMPTSITEGLVATAEALWLELRIDGPR